jgi:hypothetical protein
MVSFDFLTSSSLRKVVSEVNTSRCYQKHQHKMPPKRKFMTMFVTKQTPDLEPDVLADQFVGPYPES